MSVKGFFRDAGTVIQQRRKVGKLKKKISNRQAANRALRGGHVSGLSAKAASTIAGDSSLFNGGVSTTATKRRKRR